MSADDLQAELLSALAELGDPHTDFYYEASDFGLPAEEFAGANASVDQEGGGFGDVIFLFTILAPSANHVLRSAWDNLILPRLKSRLGADVIGDEVGDDDNSEVGRGDTNGSD